MFQPRRKIEIHIIKNYPFSNLNRDEFGTPKTLIFGGHTHGRISSQSLKRCWREYFRENFDENGVSTRTRALPDEVRKALVEAGKDEEFIALAVKTIKDMFVTENESKKKKKEDAKSEEERKKKEFMTGQVIPFSPAEMMFFKEEFCKASIDDLKNPKFTAKLEERLKDLGTAIDIALFGRMVTSSVVNSTEAAMQVAHAVSTHPVSIEQDVFTAVDDIIKNGAAHLDSAEYDSCCYYEYSCFDYDLLVENFGGDEERAKRLLPTLLMTMAYANPTGKNTSTGTNILPSAMMVEMKAVPYNLVNAFEQVRKLPPEGMIFDGVQRLAKECDTMHQKYGIEAKRYWFSVPDVVCENAEIAKNFDDLIEKASALV